MESIRGLLSRFAENWRAASPRQRRTWTVVLASALCLFALTSALVAALAHPGGTTTAPRVVRATSTVIGTSTAMNTATPAPSPTATHAPSKPIIISHPLPPPPPTPPPPPPTPTPTVYCTPTPVPTATAVATGTNTSTVTATATSTPTSTASPTATATTGGSGCQTCPYYAGNNPTQDQIRAALDTAATKYSIPNNLLYSVAWQESKWHEDVTSCDGGVGLMQIQYYLADYFNHNISYQTCGLGDTSYDIHVLQDNAYLGAKILRYLTCYYWYGAGYGGRPWPPNSTGDGTGYANGSSAYYYWQAGLAYPDLTKADGTANPKGFCATQFATSALYPDLPSTTKDYWSCPYTPTTGDTPVVDIVLSAYNAGQGAIYKCNCIPNPDYVAHVEGYVPQFASGALPKPWP